MSEKINTQVTGVAESYKGYVQNVAVMKDSYCHGYLTASEYFLVYMKLLGWASTETLTLRKGDRVIVTLYECFVVAHGELKEHNNPEVTYGFVIWDLSEVIDRNTHIVLKGKCERGLPSEMIVRKDQRVQLAVSHSVEYIGLRFEDSKAGKKYDFASRNRNIGLDYADFG